MLLLLLLLMMMMDDDDNVDIDVLSTFPVYYWRDISVYHVV